MHDTVETTTTSRRLKQRVRRRVAKSLDLGVDRRVLLDEGVGLRNVRLGLVVVVVRDEVLDRVVRHELAELVGELRGESLVVRQDERRALHLLDEPRGRRRLAGTGSAEQHDVGLARVDALRELAIACGWSPLGTYSLMTSNGRTARVGSMLQHRQSGRHYSGCALMAEAAAISQSSSAWCRVSSIEPLLSMTTSAIASRSASLACELRRWSASSRVMPRWDIEPAEPDVATRVNDDDEVEPHGPGLG